MSRTLASLNSFRRHPLRWLRDKATAAAAWVIDGFIVWLTNLEPHSDQESVAFACCIPLLLGATFYFNSHDGSCIPVIIGVALIIPAAMAFGELFAKRAIKNAAASTR